MKMLLIILSISLVSFNAFGCTDFSGKYYNSVDNDDNNTFKMVQAGCENIQIGDESGGWKFDFDGKEQLFFEFHLGDTLAQVYLSNTLEADKWIIQNNVKYTNNDGSIEYEKSWSENFLNEDKDIVNILHSDNGSVSTTFSKRVK